MSVDLTYRPDVILAQNIYSNSAVGSFGRKAATLPTLLRKSTLYMCTFRGIQGHLEKASGGDGETRTYSTPMVCRKLHALEWLIFFQAASQGIRLAYFTARVITQLRAIKYTCVYHQDTRNWWDFSIVGRTSDYHIIHIYVFQKVLGSPEVPFSFFANWYGFQKT